MTTKPKPLSSEPFNTFEDQAALREEVLAALRAGVSGDEPDYTRRRPYSVTRPDGTVITYS